MNSPEGQEPIEVPSEFPPLEHRELTEDATSDELLHHMLDSDPATLSDISAEERKSLMAAFEGSKEIQEYQQSSASITHTEEGIDTLDELCEEHGIDSAVTQDIRNKAESLFGEVEEYVHRYSSAVRSFERSKLARFHLTEDRWQNQLEKHDRARRAAHDALIDAMRIYNRYMSISLRQKYDIDVDRHALFSDRLFHDRDFQSDWALNTDYYLRAKHLVESIEEEERKTG